MVEEPARTENRLKPPPCVPIHNVFGVHVRRLDHVIQAIPLSRVWAGEPPVLKPVQAP